VRACIVRRIIHRPHVQLPSAARPRPQGGRAGGRAPERWRGATPCTPRDPRRENRTPATGGDAPLIGTYQERPLALSPPRGKGPRSYELLGGGRFHAPRLAHEQAPRDSSRTAPRHTRGSGSGRERGGLGGARGGACSCAGRRSCTALTPLRVRARPTGRPSAPGWRVWERGSGEAEGKRGGGRGGGRERERESERERERERERARGGEAKAHLRARWRAASDGKRDIFVRKGHGLVCLSVVELLAGLRPEQSE